ncbi:MAG: hypothetical protein IKN55_10650 [Oscillospiraceae bacterium]|nr:hypothetical protein [Oscillospiraceae bacterium]
MEIQSNEDLLDVLGEDFLWTIIEDYIEHDFPHIKEALRKIGRIDQAVVDTIAWAEVQESDFFDASGFHAENGTLRISFEMPALINTKNAGGDWLFHITTCCTGTVEVPDMEHYDWNSLDFDSMNRFDILSHRDLAKNIHVVYEEQDTEADDLRV